MEIHTREFATAKGYKFLARLTADEKRSESHRLPLPRQRVAPRTGDVTILVKETAEHSSRDEGIMAASEATPDAREIAQRELLVHFFRLGTPMRFAAAVEADLVRDGDDTKDPREMWAEVFQRAVVEERLALFWVAVAKRSKELYGRPNPFA